VGAGYSDHPRLDTALTLAHHIADLVALMDHLQLRGFVIVGQDWGGPQGVGAALQRVERLAGLVLIDIIGFNQNRASSAHRMRGTGDDNSRGDCASRTQSPSRDQRCPRWSDVRHL
jgi:pimeloyl-ACP methyl ester carboxylesterase